MKSFVLALALYTGALGPAPAFASSVPPHNAAEAWAFACSVMDYDCSEIDAPPIVWTGLFIHYGIFGGYDGSDHVMIDTDMLRFADKVFVNSVIAHEFTHYLDVQTGAVELPYTKDKLCVSENNGWRVGNAYVVFNGRRDLANFDWALTYGCYQ